MYSNWCYLCPQSIHRVVNIKTCPRVSLSGRANITAFGIEENGYFSRDEFFANGLQCFKPFQAKLFKKSDVGLVTTN
jgi:hypothetical protein